MLSPSSSPSTASSTRTFTDGLIPRWNVESSHPRGARFESWTLHAIDPQGGIAFWIQLSVLVSANSFRRIAEARVKLAWKPSPSGNSEEGHQVTLRQQHDIALFNSEMNAPGFEMGPCSLRTDSSRGEVLSRGKRLEWDMRLNTTDAQGFPLTPKFNLQGSPGPFARDCLSGNVRMSGRIRYGDREWKIQDACGSLDHTDGTLMPENWARLHADRFVTDSGEPVDCKIDAFCSSPRGSWRALKPNYQAFQLEWKGQRLSLNTWLHALRSRSKFQLTEWNFEFSQKGYKVQGTLQTNLKDFSGLVYENTDGNSFFSSLSLSSYLRLLIFREGKLEQRLTCPDSAYFEMAAGTKSQYVQPSA